MSSFNGLKKIAATDIQNSGRFYLGNQVDTGTAGQALVSGGPNEPARWDTHTGTIQPLTMGTNVSLASGNPTFDGGTPDTLNSVDTTYTAGNGIQISGSNIIQTKTDNQTIRDSGGGSGNNLEVIKVPNDLTFTGYATGTYNGSGALNINLVDTDTTYSAGTNLNLVGTTFNVNASLTGIDSITMNSTPGSTAITGNNYPSNPTTCSYLDLSSSTNVFPKFVGGSEILKSLSYIDNPSVVNYNRIYNTANDFIFSGGQEGGSDTLEIDFTATSTSGYCEFGFYANSYTSGMIFMVGIAAATGGTSPFSTTLTSSPVSIDAFKLGLFDGSTNRYSIKEILDFTSYENTYITSNFFFNNLSVGTRYRMALYGRCYNSGQIVINTGFQDTSGYANRSAHQPAFMKFYEYDDSIGGARTTGSGGGGGAK